MCATCSYILYVGWWYAELVAQIVNVCWLDSVPCGGVRSCRTVEPSSITFAAVCGCVRQCNIGSMSCSSTPQRFMERKIRIRSSYWRACATEHKFYDSDEARYLHAEHCGIRS